MKHFYLLRTLAVLIFCCGWQGAKAQLWCPTNINFELGSLTNWQFYVGRNNGFSGLSTLTSTTPLSTRHTLTSGTGTDFYGGFPIVDPIGGSYSLKIGNDGINGQVDQARYTFTVPTSINNYSLIYRYAVVLENPAHSAAEQPFFRVRVYDSATSAIINCASFTYVSQSSLPGFSTSPYYGQHTNGAVVYYRPWSTASLNLTGQAGKTIVVEFTTADCSQNGHMGYGYVDVSCGLFAISSSTCNATSPLSAPPGFQKYTWFNSNYSTIVDTGQFITVPTPATLTAYHVVLTPYPGYGCADTLTTQIIGSTLAVNAGRDTMLCNNPGVALNPVVTGNGAPYTYSWAPAAGLSCTTCPSPTASPLTNTSYVVSVTDSFGCTKKDTVLVKAAVNLNTSVVAAQCANTASGSATATATLGTAPYGYSWNTTPTQTGPTATSLATGSYTVIATDAKGCTATRNVTVTSPPALTAGVASTDSVSCNGGSDGKATAMVAGGVAPYSYSWNSIPVQTSRIATGLPAGVRIVTVTDSNGCTDTGMAAVPGPAPIVAAITKTATLCRGSSTGTAGISATGGLAPYTYAIDAGSFGPATTFTGLNAGPHVIHIKDAKGCTKDTAITIAEPAALILNYTATQPLCNGDSTGTITISGNGGTPGYEYALGSGSFSGSATFAGLAAGGHVLHLRDANGCTADSTMTLAQPPPLAVSMTTANVLCNGGSTGSVSLSASGGTSSYAYAIGSGTFGSSGTFGGLPVGPYALHVKDANGCTKDTNTTITEPPVLSLTYTSVQPSCSGVANGSLNIAGTGGVPPYQYSLNTFPFTSSGGFSGLSAGTYTLHVRDANNCTKDSIITLSQPTTIATSITKTDVSCFGGSNGSIQVAANGGTSPYTYSWTGTTQTSSSVTGLAAGSYTATVTDSRGCSGTATATITQPLALSVSTSTVQPSCNGGSNGAITVLVAGGTPVYQYAIGSGGFGSSPAFAGLTAGTYLVQVRDANACTAGSTINLAQPAALAASLTIGHVLCHGGATGSIAVMASGGTSAYSYALGSGAFGSSGSFTGLSTGTYILHLRDANGCTKDTGVLITEPAVLSIGYTSIQPTCAGAANGTISITGAGGTTPYQYSLNTFPWVPSGGYSGLFAGTYTLHIRDANSCTEDSVIILAQPTPVNGAATKTNVTCYGGSDGTAQVTASGGTGPYTYAWTGSTQTGSSVTGLAAGTYTVTITDSKGCTGTTSTTITQPSPITATFSSIAPICSNTATGSATVAASGGTPPYSYAWATTPVRTSATANLLNSGSYTVAITDAAGCTVSAGTTVPQTLPVTVAMSAAPVSCYGLKDGSATATPSGSASPFTYTWNTTPVQTGATAGGLAAGTYTVTATSALGCVGTGIVTVTQPAVLVASPVATGTCPGYQQGSILGGVSGGNAPYTYLWSTAPAQTTATANGLGAGTYTLIVADSKGCRDTAYATIDDFDLPEVDAGPAQEICRGTGVQLNGAGAVTYTWAPGGSLSCVACNAPLASPETNTVYTVTGTDANGCTDTDTVTILVMQRVPVAVSGKVVICEGDTATLTASGGTAWQWFPSSTVIDQDSTVAKVRPQVTTIYKVVVRENRCFTDTLEQEVEVLPAPTVDLGPDLEGLMGAVLQLNAEATGTTRITWIPGDGLSCSDCFRPTTVVRGKATYVAKVENYLGCPATDTINIKDICDANYFFFANAFTPNGDGQNDRFYPQGVGTSRVAHFMIYDRWGEIVFSATNINVNDPSAGWDGTFRNQTLKPDVYVYVMDAYCETGNKVVIRGDVSLIR